MRRAALAPTIAALIIALTACDLAGIELDRSRTCRIIHVGDGDSLRVSCSGLVQEVRLHCIDAPELGQRPWGKASRDELRRIAPRTVTLRVVDTDAYGRLVAQVRNPATGASVNLAMVRSGHAAVYRRYCQDRRFAAAEEQARAQRLGIWARPGQHQRPWDYRRR